MVSGKWKYLYSVAQSRLFPPFTQVSVRQHQKPVELFRCTCVGGDGCLVVSPAAERNKHTHKKVVINTHIKKLSTIFPWPELVKQRRGKACLRLYSQLLPAARHLQLPNAGSAHKLVCHTTTPAKKSPTSSRQLEVADFKNAATGFRCLNTCVLLSCTCESH